MKVIILILFIFPITALGNRDGIKEEYHQAVKLKQVDYRRRLSVKLGVPFLSKIRVRPSVEYRLKTKNKD
jgi:hypothetical protein